MANNQQRYSEDEVVAVYEFAVPEKWEDAINYLTRENRNFTEGMEDLLINDLKKLEEKGVPFEKDPQKAYKLLIENSK